MDNKSPYAGSPEEKRRENIIKDYIKDSKWKESKEIKEAIIKYREYSSTLSSELLENVKGLLYRLGEYLKTVTFDSQDVKENSDSVDMAFKAAEKIGKTLESLQALEERVKKEITQKTTIRGGQTLGMFSE